MPMEAQWDLKPGTSLAAFSLGEGALRPICMDATYFETFRVARAAGPTSWRCPWPTRSLITCGTLRDLAKGAGVAGVRDQLLPGGEVRGDRVHRKKRRGLPAGDVTGGDGILAQASSHDDEIVVADIDLDALHEYRASNPLRFNPKLYSNYPVGLYDRARSARREERQRHASHGTGEDRGGGVRTP